GSETYHVPAGSTWWKREGVTRPPRYDHGGLSLAEMAIPGAVLRRVTEKAARAELQGFPAALSVAEDARAEFAVSVANTGTQPLSYELLARTNLGEGLETARGQLQPGETASHQWAVVGVYRQAPGGEIDRTATLTAVTLQLRHTDLSGQWHD